MTRRSIIQMLAMGLLAVAPVDAQSRRLRFVSIGFIDDSSEVNFIDDAAATLFTDDAGA